MEVGMANNTATETGKRAKPAGRQDRSGQEAVTKPTVVAEKIDQLERLAVKANEAAKDFSDAVKKAAEASGYTAAAIRALVTARVGDTFPEKRRSVEQQLELFNEVGE